jgi:hypothetical protein
MLSNSICTDTLFKALATDRQMTSLTDKEIIANGDSFKYLRSDWVSLYYDQGHCVKSDDGRQTAYRSITTGGEKLWLVFSNGKKRGFHSEHDCPFDAFVEARDALDRRRSIRSNWDEVKQLGHDLRLCRITMNVKTEDAEASPLCAMGTRHFLRRLGMAKIKRISGFSLAWLMLIEPQLGFVLHHAALRECRSYPLRFLSGESTHATNQSVTN